MELFGLVFRSFLEVLLVGALLGAGLPALFAVGVRMLAASDGALRGRVAAYSIFALVVAIVLVGIAVIVADGMGVTLGG
ncbi:MAG: hypothetical protein WBL05_10265 [Brooklawnia sp.]|uniref:hypothetical protein n=1 Tax=Brooklawnia sp. TaxID=2699740 RepID=UPI003C75140C